MPKVEQILGEMDGLLDALVANAEKLLELSQRVISEEELGPLQKKQQKLLDDLVAQDEAFHKACKGNEQDYHSPLRNEVTGKLELFEKLNASFIENITASHGLIHFENGALKKHPKNK